MNAENCLAAFHVRLVNYNLPVKPSRAKQCRVKHVRSVCSAKNDESFFVVKSVHLYKQLVKRLLTFIISAQVVYTALADCIKFIDENDAGSFLACSLEQIAYAAGTDANKHFYKIRAAYSIERNSSLACYSAGKQCLTCSRRSHQKYTLRNFSADISIFFWRLKEIDNFHKLFLCFINTGNICKASFNFSFVNSFCP